MIELIIVVSALLLTLKFASIHRSKRDAEIRAISTVVLQKQIVKNSPALRRLYVKALKNGQAKDIHDWLNEIEGEIRLGHIWLVRQYVMNRKSLPYPVPSFT